MIRFTVYDRKGPADTWPLVNAYLIGPDDVPVRGEIDFKRGEIRCMRRGVGAVGLCLQYDAGRVGTLMLQTCLLPEKKQPYVLSVELARHRIKMFIAKSEEWQMFDLSAEHPAVILWEQARQLLTEAWTAEDPLHADRAAQKSLTTAIDASERLAMAHAEILLHRRYGQRAASNSTLGVRVWPGRDSQPLKEIVARDFDIVVIPLKWNELEIKEGTYDWDKVDRWMNWAHSQGKPIVAGPLLDFSKRVVPQWMYVWQHDYDTCRDLIYDHIEKVLARYSSVVTIWNVASGLNVNSNFVFTPDQMLDMVRMTVLAVRQHRKNARTMIELTEPFGEHCGDNRDSVFPFAFIDRLVQQGIRLDAIGVQLMFGKHSSGRAVRDLMSISSMLDRFFLLEIPVVISALGVPSEPIDKRGGQWYEPWSPQQQTKWISRIFGSILSKPFIESIFWSELFDHADADVPGCGLISETGKAKPGLTRLTGLRRHLRKPIGPLKLPNRATAQAES